MVFQSVLNMRTETSVVRCVCFPLAEVEKFLVGDGEREGQGGGGARVWCCRVEGGGGSALCSRVGRGMYVWEDGSNVRFWKVELL